MTVLAVTVNLLAMIIATQFEQEEIMGALIRRR
jgi:hypothetical protein